MKKYLLLAMALAVMGSAFVFAHDKAAACKIHSDKELKSLSKKLKLSADQEGKLKAILDEKAEKLKAVCEQEEKISAETKEKISGILDASQKEKFEKADAKKSCPFMSKGKDSCCK